MKLKVDELLQDLTLDIARDIPPHLRAVTEPHICVWWTERHPPGFVYIADGKPDRRSERCRWRGRVAVDDQKVLHARHPDVVYAIFHCSALVDGNVGQRAAVGYALERLPHVRAILCAVHFHLSKCIQIKPGVSMAHRMRYGSLCGDPCQGRQGGMGAYLHPAVLASALSRAQHLRDVRTSLFQASRSENTVSDSGGDCVSRDRLCRKLGHVRQERFFEHRRCKLGLFERHR